jgi:hypothetical protein
MRQKFDVTGNLIKFLEFSASLSCLSPLFTGCVQFLKKIHCANKRFLVTSNLRYMHGVLNVDKIKN